MFKYFSKLLALVLVCLLLVPAPLIVAAEGNTEPVQITLDSANQSKIKSNEKGMFIFLFISSIKGKYDHLIEYM